MTEEGLVGEHDPGPEPSSITLQRRVEWSDTDASGHYHNATVVRWVEAAEAEMHRRLGIVSMTFGQTPRVHFEADFVRRVAFMDEVTINLSVMHVGRSSARYGFEIHHADHVIATGWYAVAHVPRGTSSTHPWPERVRMALRTGGPTVEADRDE